MKKIVVVALIGLLFSCGEPPKNKEIKEVSLKNVAKSSKWPVSLSEWHLFARPMADLQPSDNVFPYEINATLFTDYAHKSRFIKLPTNSTIKYHPTETLEFPEGTVLVKNFYYPVDFRKPQGERKILETRLLVNTDEGWEAVPYIWNDDQTEASLSIGGGAMNVSWLHNDGSQRTLDYSVPNQVQCKSCHERNGKFSPIGPSARQLNKNGQLVEWESAGFLTGLPKIGVPQIVDYNDKSASVELRAKAWLEINCAHCHNEAGPAKNSGLYLMASEEDDYKFGIGKPPVAAGKGSGGLKYDIVPGNPEESILYYRIKSLDPGVMMPELGRKTEHKEGVEIIREWILAM